MILTFWSWRSQTQSGSQDFGQLVILSSIAKIEIDGKLVSKKYTPISPVNEKGKATFAIKVYRKCDEFPNGADGGLWTQYFEQNIKVGDTIMCEGPIGKIKYFGHGKMHLMKKELKPKTKIGLIAGGSGITPMYVCRRSCFKSRQRRRRNHLAFLKQDQGRHSMQGLAR